MLRTWSPLTPVALPRALVLDSGFRPAVSDSVWLVWGGNDISHPVGY